MIKLILYLSLIGIFSRIFALQTTNNVEEELNKLNKEEINELVNNQNSQLSLNLDKLISMEQDLTSEQRESLKALIPYLLHLYLEEQILKNQLELNNQNNQRPEDVNESEEDESSVDKRSKMSKKESPNDQKYKDFLRRQQTARWDIGFGKRGGNLKSKSFMDALYGKRSGLKHLSPKVSFGRKQQWDIQYGK